MKPKDLTTRIFLDSGDPKETREAIKILGFLDGQTTNPTLVSKHPEAQKRLQSGKKFTKDEISTFYHEVIKEIETIIPDGSISIEVYADPTTTVDRMFAEGMQMCQWIKNAHIKYPTNAAGLEAAAKSIQEHMKVNMTLCFSQEQAAAVYAATQGARIGDVYVSPFIGRLDDIGENGIDLIKNIMNMYQKGDHHVDVLSASIRTFDHFMAALALKSEIITAPLKILKEWSEQGLPIPGQGYRYNPKNLRPINYQELDLNQSWNSFNLSHDLTSKGIERFAQDWNALVE